ncbi:hypothetical protein pdam_00012846 [Pocillopora damicornis]|uniref:Uncharacterized protein n=1 Tax=Pocillopora damicornis TaxID=46731 RepID=A0A3M6UUN6_POCDA|nr:dehydrogenase/reductase SDR family member on chromosome X-like [Pocillopora damicornis]RMX57299.1 hypothetical protein pdam_00012846 [Pocillopora damicornis]
MASAMLMNYLNGAKVLMKQVFSKHNSLEVIPNLDGRVAIVTGGNKGIGLETVRGLCKAQMTVIIACRDTAEAEKAIKKIREELPQAEVEYMELDLASLASIRKFVMNFKKKGLPLHILVNNAGIMIPPYSKTEDGFELQFGVNHLGHFALTNLLLDDLIKSGSPDRCSRVVTLSSEAHIPGKINFEDLQSKYYYSPYSGYSQSKLANILFTYELQKRLEERESPVTANAVHPGVVNTDLFQHIPWIMRMPQNVLAYFLFKTPQQGAENSIYVALSPELESKGGKYFVNCQSTQSSDESYSEDVQRRLWKASCELTGIPE